MELGDLDFTGERCVPGPTPPDIVYEHVHRYLFARQFARGKDVVDVGCGEGYGTHLLGAVASSVVGVDIDEPTLAHAAAKYSASNVRFVVASAVGLAGLDPGFADLAVCLETIEHVSDHDSLLSAIRRVLKPGGLLVISTPDREVYTTDAHHNPFHVRELNRVELEVALARHFARTVIYTQSFSGGSIMTKVSDDGAEGAVDFVGAVTRNGWTDATVADRRPYLLAVASDDPPPSLPSSSRLHDTAALFATFAHQQEAAALELLEADLQRQREAAALSEQVAHWKSQAEIWQSRANERAVEVDEIMSSRSWRWTRAARSVGSRLSRRPLRGSRG